MNTEILIIDEISMISCRIFTQLEYLFRNVRRIEKPFGGMQIIVAGDLRQLPPVPNMEYGDDGSFFIESDFIDAFHTIELSTVVRQNESDLIDAINEVARGVISTESEHLLYRLKRNLPPGEEPTHLFALNFDVDMWNAKKLLEMDGDDQVYHSKDEGDCSGMLGETKLHLKIGCPVMLIVNLSDSLVNGLTGTVTKTNKNSVEVFFKTINKSAEIQAFSFTKYSSRQKKDVGSRTQIPLKLSFAMTIHKCQGSTIDRVDLNCKNMFQYGQLVVGLSRAPLKKGLRITNFSKNLLKEPPGLIKDFFRKPSVPPVDNLKCCVNSSVELLSKNEESSPITELEYEKTTGSLDSLDFSSDEEADFLKTIENLETQLEGNINFVYILPDNINTCIKSWFETLTYISPETDQQIAENETVKYLEDNLLETKNMIQYIFNKLCHLKDDLVKIENISNKNYTEFYQKSTKINTSEEYKLKVRHLFGQNPTPNQYNVIFKLFTLIRKHILNEESKPILKEAMDKAEKEKGKQFQESAGGVGKIRYIAGWCIHKIKKNTKKKIVTVMYNRSKVKEMEEYVLQKALLEHIEAEDSELSKSCEKESLKEIERRQNIRKGLTNVTDNCSKFFQNLDSRIQNLQTERNLDVHGPNFTAFLKTKLSGNVELRNQWKNLFQTFDEKKEKSELMKDKLQDLILEQIILKYTRMSIVQLRKDYLQKRKIKKLEATRKQIRMRTESKKVIPCNMESIKNDKSENKVASHKRLQSEIIQQECFLENVFKKDELFVLCKLYQIKNVKSSISKKNIADILRPVILESDNIPNVTILEGNECTIEPGEQMENTETSELVAGPSTISETISVCSIPASEKPEKASKKGKLTKRKIGAKGKGKGKKIKKNVKWPCGICHEDASLDSVGCDRCDTWYHGNCLKIENLDDLEDEWFCKSCIEDLEKESN